MKRTTIKDLARMLNLATSTVSRALSDHPDISDSTKNRVLRAAEEFNYTANFHARFFRKQHSRLIALVLPEVNMFFTPNLIKGINKAIDNSNYSLIYFLSNDSYKKEKEIVKQCLSWAVEGVLISLSRQTNELSHLEPLLNADIKCVLLDKVLNNDKFPSVTIDSVETSRMAVSHLIDKGHKNILGIFGNPNFTISQERTAGYLQALKERNIPIKEENIISVDRSSDLEYILPPILNHNKDITAIFTMSDELLSKSIFHLRKLGLSIPRDISVISISDGVYPYLSFPNVTHVKDSGSKMGKNACKFLLESIADSTISISDGLHVSTKLVELQSVKEIEV